MKKVLYGTTALATAGLVVAGAGDAAAQSAQRIQIEVHGYMQQWIVGVDQNFSDVRSKAGTEASNEVFQGYVVNQGHRVINVDQKTNAEVCFVGQTTLDNGITVGVNVQLEAFRTSGSQNWIDETFIFAQSDRFGQLKIGSEDGAASLLTVNAPDGGISVDDAGDVPTLDMFLPVSGVIEGTAISTEADNDGDSNKITYITPRIFGLQAGGSYTPINSDTGNSPDPGDGQNSGWSAAANYSNVFANGFGVRASFGATGFNQPDALDPDGSNNGAMEIRGGGQFSYAGFTVGGGYKRTYGNTGSGFIVVGGGTDFEGFTTESATRTTNGHAWSVGGTYETGPYTVGITYVAGEGRGHAIAGTGDYKSKIGTVAGTYLLGPGIRLRGGFFYFDQEAEKVAGADGGSCTGGICTSAAAAANQASLQSGIQNTSDSDGWGGAIALTASF